MKDSVFLVLIVLMKALGSYTEDDASSVISCNMELLTWQEAVENCKIKDGYMLPFETGLGQDIDKLHIQSNADIWTADHLTLNGNDIYCGFNYLNSTLYQTREVIYGDCYTQKNYFCKTEKGVLVVYNSTRDNVHCNYEVLLTDIHSMRSIIKPGYYWNTLIVPGTVQGILCGGYKSSIGRYYANCTEKRFSLCAQNLGSSNGNRQINNICFDGIKSTITPTTVRQEITTYKTDTSTKHPMTGMTTAAEYQNNVKEIHTQEDTHSSDVWIYAVVPVGVVLSLTFGIGFIIYIYRKRLQKREKIDQPTNISNLTTVSGQNDYETIEHQQCDEHEYSSARQVAKDRVAINTYVNDVVYRADK